MIGKEFDEPLLAAVGAASDGEASGMRFEAARRQRRAALKVSNIKVRSRRRAPTP